MTDSFSGHLETVLIDVAYVRRLQSEVERLKADLARRDDMGKVLGPTIKILPRCRVNVALGGNDAEYCYEPIRKELDRLKAIVEKGMKNEFDA